MIDRPDIPPPLVEVGPRATLRGAVLVLAAGDAEGIVYIAVEARRGSWDARVGGAGRQAVASIELVGRPILFTLRFVPVDPSLCWLTLERWAEEDPSLNVVADQLRVSIAARSSGVIDGIRELDWIDPELRDLYEHPERPG